MSEKLTEQRNSSNQNRLSEAWINAIFEEFHGRFGNTFFAKFHTGSLDANGNDQGIENAKTVWAKRLSDYSPAEIARGVNTEYDYPPDLDAFKKACRPSLDYEASYHEANQQMHLRNDGKDTWSNPAIYWASVALGGDMSSHYINVKSRWKSALDKAIDDVKSGRLDSIVPKRPKLLDAPKRQGKEYSDVAKRELAKCYEILNTEPKWRKELREKGKDVSTPAVGLKPLSDYVSVNREAVEA